MLVCPYCSFSNPDTMFACMGCGSDLPPDVSLNTSMSEISQMYEPLEQESSKPRANPRTSPAPSSAPDSVTPPPASAVAQQTREKTGRFSSIEVDEEDSLVLGDMDEALSRLLLEDTGVGSAEDDDAELDPPSSNRFLDSGSKSEGHYASSSLEQEEPETAIRSSARAEEFAMHPKAKEGTNAERVRSFPANPAFAPEDEGQTRTSDQATTSPMQASWANSGQVASEPQPTASDYSTSKSAATSDSTLSGALPPRIEEEKATRPSPSRSPRAKESGSSLHRPAPTDRIDLRELHSLLQSPGESSQPENIVSIPGFSPDSLPKASETDTTPTERHHMAQWGEESKPGNPWNIETKRELVEELEEVDALSGDWRDTPLPLSAEDIEEDYPSSEASDPMEHTLGHSYPQEVEKNSGFRDEPTWGNHTAPGVEVDGDHRWISTKDNPYVYNSSSPKTDTLRGRWGERSQENQEADNAGERTDMFPVASQTRSFVVFQVDVESTLGRAPLRESQRLQVLQGVSDVLRKAMQELHLEVDEVEDELILAHLHAERGGAVQLVPLSEYILNDVLLRYESPLFAQVRGRCVLTTVNTGPNELDDARVVSQRLLRGMPVNRIWLDWSTRQQVDEATGCLEIVLPSLEEPAYELEDSHVWPSENESHSPASVRSTWVGRDAELAALHQHWSHIQKGGVSKLLLLGEPGIGRTRLLETWRQQVPSPYLFFGGGAAWCPPQVGNSPYLASLLSSHLQTLGVEPTRGLAERLQFLGRQPGMPGEPSPGWRANTLLELLTDTTGSFSTGAQSGRTAEALEWLIRASTVEAPVLLAFDDLYLFDRQSQTLFENLLRQPPPRLMIVILSSSGEFEDILFSTLPNAARLELGPLSMQECYQIVERTWSGSPLHHEQLGRLVEQAEGNPQILINMVQHHLEPQSQIRESTWQNHPSLPRSVEHSLLRRLRTLSSLEQDTLRKAAVVGDRFWKGCVEAMERLEIRDGSWGLQDGVIISHVDDRGGCLQSLEKMGLVERLANSSVAGEQEYRFQHRLLRNLCREQLPASVRQKMHQSVSQWLLVRDRERVLVPELARHLRLAGLPREAARQLLRAAKESFAEYRYLHVLSLLSENMDSIDSYSPMIRLEMLHLSAKAYEQMGDLSAALQLYEEALQRSWQLTDPHWGARLFLHTSKCQAWRGNLTSARSAALNAQALAEGANDSKSLFYSRLQLARIALMEGNVSDAFHQMKEAQPYLSEEPHPHSPERGAYLTAVAWMYRTEGKWADSVQALKDAVILYQTANNPLLFGKAMVRQGEFFLAAGDEQGAIPLLEKAAGIFRQREAYRFLVEALIHLSNAYLRRRNAQQALTLLQEAWQHCRVSGEASLIAPVAAAMSAASALVGQGKDTLRYARLASQRLREVPPQIRGWTYHFLGEAASGIPNQHAMQIFSPPPAQLPEGGIVTYCYLKAVEMFKQVGDATNQLSSLLSLTRALFASGFSKTASHILDRGVADAKQLGLGLLLDRMYNQQRLLRGNVPHSSPIPNKSISPDHSTLVVRKKGKKKSAFPGAEQVAEQREHFHSSGAASPAAGGERWQSSPKLSPSQGRAQPQTSYSSMAQPPTEPLNLSGRPKSEHTEILPLPQSNMRSSGSAGRSNARGPMRSSPAVPKPSFPPPKKK